MPGASKRQGGGGAQEGLRGERLQWVSDESSRLESELWTAGVKTRREARIEGPGQLPVIEGPLPPALGADGRGLTDA